MAIPDEVIEAYIARFPHLKYLAIAARRGDLSAIRRFAQVACRLEAPAGVSARQILDLAGLA